MRDDAFRAYLAPALTTRGVSSYLSCARRVERLLRIDLDTADLSPPSIGSFRSKLAEAGVDRSVVSSCMTAVRSYAAFLSRHGSSATVHQRTMISATPDRVADADHQDAVSGNPLSLRSVPELMKLYAAILSELRHRGVTRTGNGPVGDYAEMLFATAFGWQLTSNSNAGHDAIDATGRRYQIKARRLHSPSASRQLGAIRRLHERPFDDLAVLLFDCDLAVARAAIVPIEIVERAAKHVSHTNSWRMMMPDSVWLSTGVQDVTDAIEKTARGYAVGG